MQVATSSQDDVFARSLRMPSVAPLSVSITTASMRAGSAPESGEDGLGSTSPMAATTPVSFMRPLHTAHGWRLSGSGLGEETLPVRPFCASDEARLSGRQMRPSPIMPRQRFALRLGAPQQMESTMSSSSTAGLEVCPGGLSRGRGSYGLGMPGGGIPLEELSTDKDLQPLPGAGGSLDLPPDASASTSSWSRRSSPQLHAGGDGRHVTQAARLGAPIVAWRTQRHHQPPPGLGGRRAVQGIARPKAANKSSPALLQLVGSAPRAPPSYLKPKPGSDAIGSHPGMHGYGPGRLMAGTSHF
eukprot:TRINITY_DN52541_c0_g1_i1.p1 TRINITY_DN52541_c0_g1~~TRINITY_DN52541_c0_g1_i1.p1  ORF type:complete len:300 (+),score=49.73 TRINITY_DN52541_c0_g1_i1:101-1000(+)